MPTTFCPELVGSMSQGAAGNPTVAMIEAAFTHHNLAWRYINMEVTPANLATAVLGAHALGFRGFNLSIPHKVTVIPLLHGLGESAALMGAVNCVVRRDDQFIGENTDGKGFLASLRSLTHPAGKTVVLFGAGGAARAIAVELALAGAATLLIVNRDPSRGTDLADLINTRTSTRALYSPWPADFPIPAHADIVINATSIGLYDPNARVDLAPDTLLPHMVVADVIFNPARTRFLQDAESRGCRTLDGLGMLVNQGIIGIQYWTGIDPDPAIMTTALKTALNLP
jgi:shikimate dehydrogenase